MLQNYVIRPARFSDAMEIYEVIRDNPDEVLPRSLPDIMLNFERFWVYQEGKEIMGVISWRVLPILDIENPDFALEIVSLSVKQDCQREGIGSDLLHTMLGYLEQYEPNRVLVLTFYPEFFAKFGFTKTDKKALHPKIYLGCINCTKYPSPLTCPEVAMEYRYDKK